MEVQYFGANCVRLSTKKLTIVVDDNLASIGQKSIVKTSDIVLLTSSLVAEPKVDAKLVIAMPGEYEVANVSILGVAARSHMDEEGKTSATIFKVTADDVRTVVLGHIYPDLNETQLEELGRVDVLIIPVGGNGYTLDSLGALKLIKKIEPKIVIPTQYADKALNYEVPAQTLEDALKGLTMEPKETVPRLKIKPGDFDDTTSLVVLERQ